MAAATQIQAAHRGLQARQDLKQRRKQHGAATQIQAMYRGGAARKKQNTVESVGSEETEGQGREPVDEGEADSWVEESKHDGKDKDGDSQGNGQEIEGDVSDHAGI